MADGYDAMGEDGRVAADGRAEIVRGNEAQELNRIANERYLTEAGRGAYEAIAPMMDVTIVAAPERWQTWTDSMTNQALLDLGYSEDEMAAGWLPPDR